MKYNLLFTILILFTSCSYVKDKLVIINLSKEYIYYTTLLLDKESDVFFTCSAGGSFNFFSNESSPLVREPIESLMKETSKDNFLYIVFFTKEDKEYVYNNIETVVINKKFITYKISKQQLEKLNWRVKYNGSKGLNNI
ncbi:hypothetical protein [Flavobacterium johnsoniae]|uniref:Lipoprotein n=1 Tax=Flavobacterium johnsoniae TaxID=986 RepID=A0A1J7CKX9_FLAJO|nr:hypothetical protein [Flavobacterium johnsoniae]OIV42216.1 hypothetical protein BKM63_11345 [Flavobacterium johnsoniae]